jgi:hypothetical protein
MTVEMLTKAIDGLNTSDFVISTDEAEQIYKTVVGVDKISINT